MAGMLGETHSHLQKGDALELKPSSSPGAVRAGELNETPKNDVVHRLAKMPSGEPISPAFLSQLLPCGSSSPITGFGVDEESIIEGRHSTTFRLLLERSLPSVAENRRFESSAVRDNANVSETSPRTFPPVNINSRAGVIPSSVFVKRIACKELPARPLSKWR